MKKLAKPYHDLRTPFTVDEKGAFAEYIVQDPDGMPDLALGANILIADTRNNKKFYIAGRIVGLRAISPFNPDRENLLYIEDEQIDPTSMLDQVSGPHTHQPMILRVQIDREMDFIGTQKDRIYSSFPIQRPPSAVSRLFFPNLLPDDNDEIPSLKEILDIKSSGISLGMIGFGNSPYQSNDKFLPYKWDIDNLDNKHIFILGESGSGKTVLLKNLAYEIRKHDKNNRVILTDVQGDIIQLLLFDISKKLEPTGWQRKVNYDNGESIKEAFGEFQLIIPARKDGTNENIVALKKLAQNRGVIVREIGLRLQDLTLPSDVEYLFKVSSEQASMLLDEEAEALVQKKPRQNVTISNLRASINRILGASQTQQLTSSGGTTYLRSTFFASLRALKSLEEYFDFHQESLSQRNNPLDYFNFDGTTILYLDELDQDEKIMWEMQLVKWLYNNKKQNWKAFVFFDEAHQIIPAKPSGVGVSGTFERLRVNFERLAREGRKFGINLVLSTQSPKDLHPIVPDMCPTRIVMKLNPRNAPYAFLDPELAMIANRFNHGQFWILSPFNGTPNWVRVHSEAPPLPHEPMVNFWQKVIGFARNED